MNDNADMFKVVGWGFIPLPGEKKRRRKALEETRELLRTVEEIEQRGLEDETEKTKDQP